MKAGFVSCSNGQQPEKAANVNKLTDILSKMGITVTKAEHIYAKDGVFSGTAKERAQDLMKFYCDEHTDIIFDISGGDIANEVLGYLDYDRIAASDKVFWGYSDLTAVINAVYAKTGRASVLYQVRNLTEDDTGILRNRFQNTVIHHKKDLFNIEYEFLQGQKMEGIVTGGNIRCLLKLAGTPYWPDMNGKILLLESLGSDTAQTAAFFSQLEHMGVLEQAAGILLGTFTRLERTKNRTFAYQLLREHIPSSLPVAYTPDIGHSPDAKAIVIGSFLRLAEIKTERLTLRPQGMRYLDTVHDYASDPENTRYMMFLPNDSIIETIHFLNDSDSEWQKKHPSFYEFAIIFQDKQIGSIGLTLDNETDEAEFGWIISKKYWNRGIAFEAAQALLAFAVKELGILHFIAHCDLENAASYRVMEKLGMKRADVHGGRKNKLSDEERLECLYRLSIM